tara:strand:- start:96044 stop:96364 length:321 start_codon:yes stop_codon:yes gene_type:complete
MFKNESAFLKYQQFYENRKDHFKPIMFSLLICVFLEQFKVAFCIISFLVAYSFLIAILDCLYLKSYSSNMFYTQLEQDIEDKIFYNEIYKMKESIHSIRNELEGIK